MRNEECGSNGLRMSGLTRFFDRSAIKALPAACLLACLAACAQPVSAPAPVSTQAVLSDDEALNQLRTGKVVLDCGPSCAPKWSGSLAELQTHYNAEEWRDLALLVIHTNYSQDLAYFYLGRAAEGLGARSSALAYYGTARGLATGADNSAKCGSTPQGCNGLSLLTETLTRTQIVEEARRRSFVRHQPHATGQQPPDSWVDPEPASP